MIKNRTAEGFRRIGFSLVELSVVLVVIGLITGGVVAGKSMIRSADLLSISSDLRRYQDAAITFRDKYRDLPGDMSDAQDYWGSATTNGDSDGVIGSAPNPNTSGEIFEFWNQLALDGRISGKYTGKSGTSALDTVPSGANANAPAARLSNTAWAIINHPKGFGDNNRYQHDYGNAMVFGGVSAGDLPLAGALTPDEAWRIDTKIDDGKPASGSIIAVEATGPTVGFTNTNAAAKCTTSSSNTDYIGVYNVSNKPKACALYAIAAKLNEKIADDVSHQNAGAPTNGACSATAGACLAGAVTGDDGITTCGTTRHWSCAGTNGGTTASCSTNNSCAPGACDNSTALGCTAGTLKTGSDNNLAACGTTRSWVCQSANGGADSSLCSKANAACVSCTSTACGSTAHGGTCNSYAASTVAYGSTCAVTTSTCNNGSWSTPPAANATCTVAAPASCAASGACGSTLHNGTCTTYTVGSVTSPNTCPAAIISNCSNGGWSTLPGANATCVVQVNGSCSATAGACTTGSVTGDNGLTCGANRTWSCAGTNGGTTASCSKTNAACPVNGSCSAAALQCSTGSYNYDDSVAQNGWYNDVVIGFGSNRTWSCAGNNGGTTASCLIAYSNYFCSNGQATGSGVFPLFLALPSGVSSFLQIAKSDGATCGIGNMVALIAGGIIIVVQLAVIKIVLPLTE